VQEHPLVGSRCRGNRRLLSVEAYFWRGQLNSLNKAIGRVQDEALQLSWGGAKAIRSAP
jgi:hypothetical protein